VTLERGDHERARPHQQRLVDLSRWCKRAAADRAGLGAGANVVGDAAGAVGAGAEADVGRDAVVGSPRGVGCG